MGDFFWGIFDSFYLQIVFAKSLCFSHFIVVSSLERSGSVGRMCFFLCRVTVFLRWIFAL